MAEREKEVIVTDGGGGGGGGVIAAVVLIIVVLIGLYVVFGTHLIRGGSTDVNLNINTPSTK
jgi:hypothetical protein